MRSFIKNVVQRKDGSGGGLIGRTIKVGSFTLRVEAHLADGGFACIYKVRDVSNGQAYAMKHMRLMGEPDAIADCMTEVNTLKKLRDVPSVITLRAAAFSGTRGNEQEAYLILDLCKENLVEFIQNQGNKLNTSTIIQIFSCIAQAVSAMHQQNPPLAHRDLKAENVLQSPNGDWVLCDFGSVTDKVVQYESSNAVLMGEEVIRKYTTPSYRAPEMWDLYSRERIDTKADIWALGCLLYFLMFGKIAFQPEAKLQILNGDVTVPPTRPPPLVGLLKDLLVVNPVLRPNIFTVLRRLQEVAEAMNVDPALLVPRTPVTQSSGHFFPVNKEAVQSLTPRQSVVSTYPASPTPQQQPSHPSMPSIASQSQRADMQPHFPAQQPLSTEGALLGPQLNSTAPPASIAIPTPSQRASSFTSRAPLPSQGSLPEAGGFANFPSSPEQSGFANFANFDETKSPMPSKTNEEEPQRLSVSPPKMQRKPSSRQSSIKSLDISVGTTELTSLRKLAAELQSQNQQLQSAIRSQQATIKQLQVDNYNHVSQLKRLGLDPTPSIPSPQIAAPAALPTQSTPGWASFGSSTSFDTSPHETPLAPLRTTSPMPTDGSAKRSSPTKARLSAPNIMRSPRSRGTPGGPFDAFATSSQDGVVSLSGQDSAHNSPSETMSRHSALSAFAESLKQPALMADDSELGSPLSDTKAESKPYKPSKRAHRRSTSEPVAMENWTLVVEDP